MKTIVWIFSLSLLLTAGFFVSSFDVSSSNETSESEAEVQMLIEDSYIHGAFNDLNPEAMEEGFHEDFAIYSPDGEQIAKYPIDRWIESVRNRKSNPDFDPAANRWEHEFVNVDVTGHSAAAKINLFREGRHVYTDYLSLLKFDSGWKIVAKVYYQHQ